MYPLFRRFLFRLDPEVAHQLTLNALRLAGNIPFSNWVLTQLYKTPAKPVQAFGLTFKNPVGLAAGYDKDAVAINGLSALGFGHVEVGTVTPRPQPGNPKPRVFRLVEDEAVINRMGFPSRGSEFVQVRLKPVLHAGRFGRISAIQLLRQRNKPITSRNTILGINLG
jgi:dihydroorotate dehydrogenase